MRRCFRPPLLATLSLAAPASAEVAHTVAPGETLWSIAAANNLTTRTVAAYNGLSEDAPGRARPDDPRADGRRGLRGAAERRRGDGTTAAAPAASGSYSVQPGDTLTAIAANAARRSPRSRRRTGSTRPAC